MKKIYCAITFSSLLLFSLITLSGNQSNNHLAHTRPSILLVHAAPTWGGIAQHVANLYGGLKNRGYDVSALLLDQSRIDKEFTSRGWSHFTMKKSSKEPFDKSLLKNLTQICTNQHIDIIHVNWPSTAAKVTHTIKAKFPHVKTIFTHHGPSIPKPMVFKNFDYLSCVAKRICDQIMQAHYKKLKNAPVWLTPPCFDETKFDSFVPPLLSAQEFFKKNFNLTLGCTPIICMIANLFDNKNHLCLLQAMHTLVYEYRTPVHLMLAGEGPFKRQLVSACDTLKLVNYVHFLGYVKQIPELLHYSQIKVLSSWDESFGVCLLEAGLMKRPVIFATETCGANFIVLDKQTGLLFKNRDARDLADKIKCLLDNEAWARQLGENAYNYIKTNFSSAATIERFIELYEYAYQH